MLIYLGATPQVADEAIQEAFLELGRKWDTVRTPAPWVSKATKTHFLKICQKIRKAQRRERGLAEEDSLQVPDTSAEVALSAWEDEEWVTQLLQHLSPAAKATVALILEDYSTAEIAAHLGLTENAVRQRLHSARNQLKQLLGPDCTIKDRTGPARTRGEVE
ncbi:sigma-70 family RNA polymerase sigma factor [Nocardia sp. NPDC005366]|uniref:RNA polymerase sigma factor n=1 Tax=Nocardia sp. NPDC005366 TaxID=3156878 RepID=UPI0033B163F7